MTEECSNCDIKPENIVIRKNGQPVLIDLGASVGLDPSGNLPSNLAFTPDYAAPELLSCKGPLGPWTDIFSIAATMYELMTGGLPNSKRRGYGFDPLVPMSASAALANEPRISPVAQLTRGQYSTQLMLVVDRCLQDYQARPRSIQSLMNAFSHPENLDSKSAVLDVSGKMLHHFMNWATPNKGLYADEFAIFLIAFPILDLGWRLMDRVPIRDMFDTYVGLDDALSTVTRYQQTLIGSGFDSLRSTQNESSLLARSKEYAMTYEEDRRADRWTYESTKRLLVTNCLTPLALVDAPGFSALMENVIDRARSRIKKVVRSALSPYYWIPIGQHWEKKLKDDHP